MRLQVLIISMLLSLTAVAQMFRLDTVYTYSWAGEWLPVQRQIFTGYSEDTIWISSLVQRNVSGQWIDSLEISRVVYLPTHKVTIYFSKYLNPKYANYDTLVYSEYWNNGLIKFEVLKSFLNRELVSAEKSYYSYDTAWNLTKISQWGYDLDSGKYLWQGDFVFEYFYLNGEFFIKRIEYSLDSFKNVINYYYSNSYDSAVAYSIYGSDTVLNFREIVIQKDSFGNPLKTERKVYSTVGFTNQLTLAYVDVIKREFYDGTKLKSILTSRIYGTDTIDTLYYSLYDLQGLPLEKILVNEFNGSITFGSKYYYAYEYDSLPKSVIKYKLNTSTLTWERNTYELYFYNAYRKLSQYEYYVWNSGAGGWVLNRMRTLKYDIYGNVLEDLVYKYYPIEEPESKKVYIWQKIPTLLTNLDKSLIVYPNPVMEVLYLSKEVDGLEIVDLSGRVVKKIDFRVKFLDVNDLKPGVYILRGDDFSVKFVKL